MKSSIFGALIVSMALLTVGCASQSPDPIPTPITAKASHAINASSLVVRDYSSGGINGVQEYGVYHDGWANWNQSAFAPAFGESISHRLGEALIPSGEGRDIEIVVIRSDISTLRRTSDSIVFVGLATAGRDYEYRCDLEFALETEDINLKRVVSFSPKPRQAVGDPFFYDDPRGSYVDLIDECHEGLVGEVAVLIAKETDQ